ncbi:colanic acid biosynthesis glycosyl transferase WcaI [Hephaestia caeni]|uniref:Colanic acid biosynthesis glycosyl transferase WcaI n=1 Tax=Hephaestia caeni TaxID=645617 RepID=A0A397NJ80_9SPHN|nr:WcaI family glycosyltransferase [Hephaestia caeni]RIA35357.1 colanic acid biosynthesis glycosyl transferase WcaI [Hephaestia caeni]
MRVLFLGLNYAPETIGIAAYTTGLCEDLAAMGHDVRVVTAKPYYPKWRTFDGYRGWWKRETENGVDLTRCPIYVPANPTGVRRLVHHVTFALSSFLPMMKAALGFKPDLVMTAAPSLIAAPIAWLAAKVSGTKSWLHIQDFEVEAAFATGLLNEQSRVWRFARKVEHTTVRLFDQVSSISPEMCAKLASFGTPPERIYEFRNWAEIDAVRPLDHLSSYRAEWNITAPHVALYSGNIANKQGIGIVVEAAKLLAHRDDLTFVICGQGPNRANLEAEASGLSNIRFFDLQPSERLGEMLGLATVHLLPQKANAADLVLPSKLTNMLASGRPAVVTAAPGTGLAREVEGCCLVTAPEDGAALAAAIERLIDDPTLHSDLSSASRQRAEAVWHRRRIIEAVERRMQAITEHGNGRHNRASAARQG